MRQADQQGGLTYKAGELSTADVSSLSANIFAAAICKITRQSKADWLGPLAVY